MAETVEPDTMIEFDQNTDVVSDPRVSTGVPGLDDILAGGLMAMERE
jgi:hypothetical protein